MDAKRPASELAKGCLIAYERCLAATAKSPKHHECLENRLADFNLWADGVGAFARLKASLDTRLKIHPDELTIVKSNLILLHHFLEEYASFVEEGISVVDVLQSIDSSLSNLTLFAKAIRRSGRKSRVHKADRTFNSTEHTELELHLKCIALLRPGTGPRGSSDLTGLTSAQRRLIDANLRRRNRFIYAQRHSKRLQAVHLTQNSRIEQRVEPDKNPNLDDRPVSSSRDPEGRISTDNLSTKHQKGAELKVGVAPSTTGSGTTASAPESKFQYTESKNPNPSRQMSMITSIASKARYPGPVIPPPTQMIFKCPCCCQPMPVEDVIHEDHWRKHLVEDLCPYTCIADNCPTPHLFYSKREDWEKHVKNDHDPAWQCPLCDDGDPLFSTMAGIMDHLNNNHGEEISEDTIPVVLSLSAVNPLWVEACPLCESVGPRDSPELVDHVLEHMHDFSLRSLPWALRAPLETMRVVGVHNLEVRDAERLLQWLGDVNPEISTEGQQPQLQLCQSDIAPFLEFSQDTGMRPNVMDYFDENDYFAEELKDDSMSFEIQTNDSTLQLYSGVPTEDGDEEPYIQAKSNWRTLSHDAYSVAWICALPKEQTPATTMLDEIHPNLPQPSDDHNCYTLGSIGGHNIVIACFPKDDIGNSFDLPFVNRLIGTFPSIKIGFMVGIADGIAPEVRPGDVVVSTPVGKFPGVIQLEFGKSKDGGEFTQIGSLNNPPSWLLTALSELDMEHNFTGSKIMDEVNEKWPVLAVIHWRSDSPETDDSRASKTTEKEPREMRVHYGLIASGNPVTNDASFRDRIYKEFDGHILCVETEAVGMINDFPCIVIRGICDYADASKNNVWQSHAAAMAAAFAKELLGYVQPRVIDDERSVKDILDQSQPHDTVSTADHEILDWLTPRDYSYLQRRYLAKLQPGTGQWFLNSAGYQTWLNAGGQVLFCPGIPGAGKTIMTATVIEDLHDKFQSDSSIGIAYLYCDFRRQDEQKAEDLLISLLKQLSQEAHSPRESVRALYERHSSKRTRPSLGEISNVLHSVAATYSRVFIIIDALDECFHSSRTNLLLEAFSLQAKCGANIFATSRPLPVIAKMFKKSISIEIRASDDDVRRYIDSSLSHLSPPVTCNVVLREEIKIEIVSAVDGMFLLAHRHLHSLTVRRTPEAIQAAFENWSGPSEVCDQAHEFTMRRIEAQPKAEEELAKQVLSWIICAKRLLSYSELQHALAVKIGERELDESSLIEDMVSVCAGLVTVDENGFIRAAHYTVLEYLRRSRGHWFPNAEIDITTVCVTYLSFSIFQSGCCKTREEFKYRLESNKLFDYAAKNWGHHARISPIEGDSFILDFLKSPSKRSAFSQAMLASTVDFENKENETWMIGLHITAYFGLWRSTGALLEESQSPNAEDIYGRTPLHYAADKGHKEVAKLLLNMGADPDIKDSHSETPRGSERTPLSFAAANGHEGVVQLLLEKHAHVELEDDCGQTPLSLAAENGHDAIVKLLLGSNADVKTEDRFHRTPLLFAAENGHEAIVQLLLDKHAVVDAGENLSQTPLYFAVKNGHGTIVKLLLQSGADIEVRNQFGRTLLSLAAENGHEAIVKLLLLRRFTHVHTKDRSGRTPLSFAAQNGHEGIVELLLEKDADVETEDRSGRTPLSFAAENGHEGIVKLLLENDADVETEDRSGRTPLSFAIENGHKTIAELLAKGRAL